MHIPDGYLGPQTCLATWGVMLPAWWAAARRVSARLGERQVPLLGAAAGFCFVVMMFNVPLPGGTTGHPTGAALAGILLGPAAAVIALSVALALQALLFGDGGITALAANCLNMAVVAPLVGHWCYRLLAGRSPAPRRSYWAGAAAGYLAINAAALGTALLLGLQPYLAHTPDGRALYCPYGLGVTLPAIMLGHLAVFGPVEAALTAGTLAFLRAGEEKEAADVPAD